MGHVAHVMTIGRPRGRRPRLAMQAYSGRTGETGRRLGLTSRGQRSPPEVGAGRGGSRRSGDVPSGVLLLPSCSSRRCWLAAAFGLLAGDALRRTWAAKRVGLGLPGGGERTTKKGEGKGTSGRAPSARNHDGHHAGEPCSGEQQWNGRAAALRCGSGKWEGGGVAKE
jgi:hypothetical protein